MAEEPESLVGGRYHLEERLGEGGFGAVHAALDTQLKRRVAVKLLNPGSEARSSEQAGRLRERFRREAIATAAIDHPNVVTVHDVGIADEGEVFIVMELLEGWSLSDELRRMPHGLDPARALPHFVQCLDALGRGHDAGIVHKDLKPSNLFLVAPGTDQEAMRVIDFGVARVLHEQKLTSTGRIVGTPRYLAPEYIEHHEVTPALDVYQMALILVETLTGQSCIPRELDLVGCCQKHLAGDLRIPAPLRRGDFGSVIRRATSLRPEDRFEDGGEFASALGAIDPSSIRLARESDGRATPRLGVESVRRSVPSSTDTPTESTRDARPSNLRRDATGQDPAEEEPTSDEVVVTLRDPKPSPAETATVPPDPEFDEPRRLGTMTHGMVYGLLAAALLTVVGTALLLRGFWLDPDTGAEETQGAIAGPDRTPARVAEPTPEPAEEPDDELSMETQKPAPTPGLDTADEPSDEPTTPATPRPAKSSNERHATKRSRAEANPVAKTKTEPEPLQPAPLSDDETERDEPHTATEVDDDLDGQSEAPDDEDVAPSPDDGMLILE